MIERIDEVLEKKVRPALLSHEGDVQIVEYADGVLKIPPDRTLFRMSVSETDNGGTDCGRGPERDPGGEGGCSRQ